MKQEIKKRACGQLKKRHSNRKGSGRRPQYKNKANIAGKEGEEAAKDQARAWLTDVLY